MTKPFLALLLCFTLFSKAGAQSPGDPAEEAHRRIPGKVARFMTWKVERVQAGAVRWAEAGRDPAAIRDALGEKVRPDFEAGKILEAEADLDGLLKQLGDNVEHQSLAEKFKPLMEQGKFVEAEAELDRLLGSAKQDGKSADSSAPPSNAAPAAQVVPEEARRQMRHNIDSSFVVFRDKVQEELKLTALQKEKLEVVLPEVMEFLRTLQGLTPEERKQAIDAFRPKAREKLEATVAAVLDEKQRTRLRQIVRQREGLRDGEVWKELQLTNEQQQQFLPLMRQAQQETRTLMEEVQRSGKREELQPKVIKVRSDLESHLQAVLTDSQREHWKEMLGPPMPLADIFDL